MCGKRPQSCPSLSQGYSRSSAHKQLGLGDFSVPPLGLGTRKICCCKLPQPGHSYPIFMLLLCNFKGKCLFEVDRLFKEKGRQNIEEGQHRKYMSRNIFLMIDQSPKCRRNSVFSHHRWYSPPKYWFYFAFSSYFSDAIWHVSLCVSDDRMQIT